VQPVPSEVAGDPDVNSNYNEIHATAAAGQAEDEGAFADTAGSAEIADSVGASRNGKPLHAKKIVKMTMVILP
jgi:hypothetical protein